MDAPARMTTLPSWLLSQAARRGNDCVTAALASTGLRKHHYSALVALEELGAVSQADLGRRLWIDRSDLHAVLTELEAEGLVARAPDAQDRRRNAVRLTRSGRATLGKLNARVDAAQDELLAPLSAGQRKQLVVLLGQLLTVPHAV